MHIVQFQTDPKTAGEKWRKAQTFTGATQYSEADAYARNLMRETGMKIRIIEIVIKDVFDPMPAEQAQ